MSRSQRRAWCASHPAGATRHQGRPVPTVALAPLNAFAEGVQASDIASGKLHLIVAVLGLRATPSPLGHGGYAGWVVLLEPVGDDPQPDDLLGVAILAAGCQPGEAVLFTRRRDGR